jgi:hypothetical protein
MTVRTWGRKRRGSNAGRRTADSFLYFRPVSLFSSRRLKYAVIACPACPDLRGEPRRAYPERDSPSVARYAATATDSRSLLGPLLLAARLPRALFAMGHSPLVYPWRRSRRVPFRPASCAETQKWRFASPLFATLTDSLSRKSFPCHSYANTRDGGVPIPPNSIPILLAFCFHRLTNRFPRNPFLFCVAPVWALCVSLANLLQKSDIVPRHRCEEA